MHSKIDPTVPNRHQARFSDLRRNFAHAKREIEALQPSDALAGIVICDSSGSSELSIDVAIVLKFLTATNRLAALEYIDPTHTAVAHTFTDASIGQRGYDMDTKTFWDVSDVVDGVATWIGTQSDVSTLLVNVEDLSASHYEAVVVPGFNTDVIYLTSTSLVPNFVCTADGDVIYARNSNAA